MKQLGGVYDVLPHVLPQEGAIIRRVAVVQLHRVTPSNQLSPEINGTLWVGEVRRWVEAHDPA